MIAHSVKPMVDKILPIALAYFAKSRNGIGLRTVLLGNLENLHDDDVRFCISWARDRGDADGERLGEMLLRMTRSQRARLRLKISKARYVKTEGK